MKKYLFLAALLVVAGCASPARNFSDQQIRTLSDDELCSYQNNYRTEPRTAAEISRRGLNCNRFYRECLKRGNQPQTPAMSFCVDTLKENERLRDGPAYDNFNVFGYHDYDRLRSVRGQ